MGSRAAAGWCPHARAGGRRRKAAAKRRQGRRQPSSGGPQGKPLACHDAPSSTTPPRFLQLARSSKGGVQQPGKAYQCSPHLQLAEALIRLALALWGHLTASYEFRMGLCPVASEWLQRLRHLTAGMALTLCSPQVLCNFQLQRQRWGGAAPTHLPPLRPLHEHKGTCWVCRCRSRTTAYPTELLLVGRSVQDQAGGQAEGAYGRGMPVACHRCWRRRRGCSRQRRRHAHVAPCLQKAVLGNLMGAVGRPMALCLFVGMALRP